MSGASNPPRSPTLQLPRKSVELEDPGAHDLESSEHEDDVFADASEGQGSNSRPSSPIPTTRVEKVDDRENHGEVPGTEAYRLRTQDAVPDELEIISDGNESRSGSRDGHTRHPEDLSIPRTVVEKVDPTSPSHGDIPGTTAHSLRSADAVPDAVFQASDDRKPLDSGNGSSEISAEIPIPKTMITKVDSKPSHGEVHGTDAFKMRQGDAQPDAIEKKGDISSLPTSLSRSQASNPKRTISLTESASPIAADGGFGPMNDEQSEDERSDSIDEDTEPNAEINTSEGIGDDFDDFEAGAEDDDFGDFDEGFQQSSSFEHEYSAEQSPESRNKSLPQLSPFSLPDFSDLDTLEDFITTTGPYLDEIFPTTKTDRPSPPLLPSNQNSIFLTDRSLSLWSQLVAPPPLQPPNWVRSRIRRLFLVSLGVPVDLDEILPASKQKKLILPSTHLRSRSQSPRDGRRQGSRIRLKQENASSTSIDQPLASKAKKKRGPPSPPDLDLQATKMLCATTEAALSNMTDDELRAHVTLLEEANVKASKLLEYWLKRRDSAIGDKEAFEGVIENLVKHARRVRK